MCEIKVHSFQKLARVRVRLGSVLWSGLVRVSVRVMVRVRLKVRVRVRVRIRVRVGQIRGWV